MEGGGLLVLDVELAHPRGALELVPVERPPVERELERLEQDYGEELPIGEALQPHLRQQPEIFLRRGLAALEREGDSRRHKIDQQENYKVKREPLDVRRVRGLRMLHLVPQV